VKAESDPHVVRGVDLGSCPYSRLQESGVCLYDGVRNYQARNGVRRCVFFVNLALSLSGKRQRQCVRVPGDNHPFL
jgi:predicted RNA-binding protein with PUA-like domain